MSPQIDDNGWHRLILFFIFCVVSTVKHRDGAIVPHDGTPHTHWNAVDKNVGERIRLCMYAFRASPLELIIAGVDGAVSRGYCYTQ